MANSVYNELLCGISGRLDSTNIDKLHNGLYGGKIGLLLYKYLNANNKCCDICDTLLDTLIQNYPSMPNGLLYGNLGLFWALSYMSKHRSIIPIEELVALGWNVVSRNSQYFCNAPIQFDFREPIYPLGISMLPLDAILGDSLDKYCWQEEIMFRLCDCEKFLTEQIVGLYQPRYLSLSFLHSVFAFASMSYHHRIYPYMCRHICEIIKTGNWNNKRLNNVDNYILNFLCYNKAVFPKSNIASDLAYVGLFSLVYNMPDLFVNAFKSCSMTEQNISEILSVATENELIGIGIGIANAKLSYE